MKRLLFALAALAVLAIASPPSFAAITPTPGQILARCPDIPDAKDCPPAAEDFLVPRPKSPQSDAQIVSLVLKIAEEASDEKVPLKVCLNAADGLRVLAGGVEDPGTAQQIMDIADALCDNIRTAAIGDEDETGQGGGNAPAAPLDFGSSGPSGAGGTTGENTGGGSNDPNGPPSCPTGQHLEGNTCVTNTQGGCPTGQHLEGNTCVPDTQSCPTGQHLEGNTCVPDTLSCPTGQHQEGSVCVPDTTPPLTCGEGYVPNGNYTQCVPMNEGVPHTPPTGGETCPEGQTYNSQAGKCVGR